MFCLVDGNLQLLVFINEGKKIHLRQPQVDGDGFGYVKESPISSYSKREAVERLQYVRSLMLLKQL